MNKFMIEALNGQEHPLWDFVQLAYNGKPWGWYFEVTSPDQYNAIYERFFAQARANAVWDFFDSKEFHYNFNPANTQCRDHAHSNLTGYFIAQCEKAAEAKQPMSPFHMAVQLDQTASHVHLRLLQLGTIYVNYNGGWMTMAKGFTIINRTKCATFPTWTRDDIKIIQWPGGTHFYAKIGTMDVMVDGKQKWDTRAEALQHAENYFNELTAKAT